MGEADELKKLRENHKTVELTAKEREKIRKNAEKIITRHEEEAKKTRWAELEHFYELDLYA